MTLPRADGTSTRDVRRSLAADVIVANAPDPVFVSDLRGKILEAIAVPIPDAEIGNRIVASVVARTGQKPDTNQLRAHCSRFLPTYMVPEQIEIRESMALTSTGKTDRQLLLREWQSRVAAAAAKSESSLAFSRSKLWVKMSVAPTL